MSDLRLGVPAEVAFGHAPPARSVQPRRVEHLWLGITWDVTGILDRRAHPGPAADAIGTATLVKWRRLRVSGPLTGRPAERGEFTMEISFYGDPPRCSGGRFACLAGWGWAARSGAKKRSGCTGSA